MSVSLTSRQRVGAPDHGKILWGPDDFPGQPCGRPLSTGVEILMPFVRSAFLAATLGVGATLGGVVPAQATPELPAVVAQPGHHAGSDNGGGTNGGTASCDPFCTPAPSTHMHPHPRATDIVHKIVQYVRAQIAGHQQHRGHSQPHRR